MNFNILDVTGKKAKIQNLKNKPLKVSERKKQDEMLKNQNKSMI